jgi:hypothetical protein
MFTYLPISLPLPPQPLINQLLSSHQEKTLEWDPAQRDRFKNHTDTYLKRSLTWQGQTYQTRVQYRYLLPDEMLQWVDAVLPNNYLAASIAVSQGDSPLHGPHIDFNRHYIFYLSLGTGGDNVTTTFWRKPGYPVEFDQPVWPGTAQDYPGLEQIESAVLNPNQWYVLNGWIYHSIENMSGTRLSLQIDYNQVELTTP